jgi:hypothetical protein
MDATVRSEVAARQSKASVRCAAGSLSFSEAKKKVTKEKRLSRQSKPKAGDIPGIFRLANPWLGRKTTRIHARRPSGLQSVSACLQA